MLSMVTIPWNQTLIHKPCKQVFQLIWILYSFLSYYLNELKVFIALPSKEKVGTLKSWSCLLFSTTLKYCLNWQTPKMHGMVSICLTREKFSFSHLFCSSVFQDLATGRTRQPWNLLKLVAIILVTRAWSVNGWSKGRSYKAL